MPHSMTGFATAQAAVPPFHLTWELRSVNHRFLDASFRLPEELRSLEPRCRDMLGAVLHRGKLDCTLKLTSTRDESSLEAEVDAAQLARLRALAGRIREAFPDARALTMGEVLRWPGLLREPFEALAALEEPALRCLEQAAASLQAARRREGERIGDLLRERGAAIEALIEEIRPRLAGAQERYRTKLAERLQRLGTEADPDRLEQELALIVQRLDVAEEIDRLAGHVSEVRAVLQRSEPIGRRLDFLVQELNREANTFASKVQDEELTRKAVELKVLIEQMREQVQNLE